MLKPNSQRPSASVFPKPDDPNPTIFDVSGRPITSFRGLLSLPSLKFLVMNNTQISTFEHAPLLPNLVSFSCRGAPLASQKHLHIMAVMAFGDSLRTVNGLRIDSTIHLLGSAYQAYRGYLVDGFVVAEITPLKVVHPRTRQRKTIHVDAEPVVAPPKPVETRPRQQTAPPVARSDALKHQFEAITQRILQQSPPNRASSRPPSVEIKRQKKKAQRQRTLQLPEPPMPQPLPPRKKKRVHVQDIENNQQFRQPVHRSLPMAAPRDNISEDNDYNISGEQSSMELLPTLSSTLFRVAQRSEFGDSYSGEDVAPEPPRQLPTTPAPPTGDYYESSDDVD